MSNKDAIKQSALEKVAGNLGTGVATTLVAASVGTPIAALLPLLTGALASERQRRRVEAAIRDIQCTLQVHQKELRHLSDEKYRLVNEAILAVLGTVDERKLVYLRRAVRGSLTISDLIPQEAAVLARILRDISAAEIDFLVRTAPATRIQVAREHLEQEGTLTFSPESPEALIVSGLIALGILMPAEPTWDESNLLRFSTILPKLVALVTELPPNNALPAACEDASI